MVRHMQISNFRQVQRLVDTANKVSANIGVYDGNGSIADAKSILGLMSLDFTRPVKIVSESEQAVLDCINAVM